MRPPISLAECFPPPGGNIPEGAEFTLSVAQCQEALEPGEAETVNCLCEAANGAIQFIVSHKSQKGVDNVACITITRARGKYIRPTHGAVVPMPRKLIEKALAT